MQMLSQRDPLWGEKTIGSTNLKIKDFGCLLTCLAMILGVKPDEVANRLYQASGLQGALVIWSKIDIAFPKVHFIWRGYDYNGIAVTQAVNRYGFCLVEVDFDSKEHTRDNHWVLLTKEGMIDPWTGTTKNYPHKLGYAIIEKKNESNSLLKDIMTMQKEDALQVLQHAEKLKALLARGYAVKLVKGTEVLYRHGKEVKRYKNAEQFRDDGWEFGDESVLLTLK